MKGRAGRRIGLEDLLIMVSERLLSDLKSVRVSRTCHEPYVDVRESPMEFTLTAEVGAARPGDLRVVAGSDMIELVVMENGLAGFRGVYSTPGLNPSEVRIRFNNGILEVKAQKRD